MRPANVQSVPPEIAERFTGTQDVIEPGEEDTCDCCGAALDQGDQVFVDLPNEAAFCCPTCYTIGVQWAELQTNKETQ